uniref:Uncharacterized protein n=1 Tax=Kalanchoe fedtschenkoi TaxID=63787 RepID=A0A7N0UFJ1_KALFE
MEVEEGATEIENETAEVVRWERFLPRMVLRVLLVEPDDSTRHVITALLQKCSYKVISVSDGLEAWEALKEKPQSIDLVLTEVELPSMSGFNLLTLVTDHDLCKKIPVIMMSSQDSISTVLICMLKGAADFLIKPIRKNELKNLWQHVWRRQISNAENKSPTTGEEHPEIGATSENTAASSPSNDYTPSKQEELFCMDTKNYKDLSQLVCVDSRNNLDEPCMEIDEELGLSLHKSETGECQLETRYKGDNSSATLRVTDDARAVKRAKHADAEGPKPNGEDSSGAFELQRTNNLFLKSASHAVFDLIGQFDVGKSKCKISHLTDGIAGSTFCPKLELGLHGANLSGSRSSEAGEGRLLNHSSASAFSRYNSGNKIRFPSPKSSEANSKAQGTVNTVDESNRFCESYFQIAFSNNGDKSTAVISDHSEQVRNGFTDSLGALVQPKGRLADLNVVYQRPSPWPPYAQAYQTLGWSTHVTGKPNQPEIRLSGSGSSKSQSGDCADNMNAESSNDVHEMETKPDKEDFTASVEWVHGSPTHGSNNNCSILTNNDDGNEKTREVNLDNDSGIRSATGLGSRNGVSICVGPNRVDTLRSGVREAALIKFRQKRKDRCFEKKVRYQSRKQLAEQRPRVKGQFVRQIQTEAQPQPYSASYN